MDQERVLTEKVCELHQRNEWRKILKLSETWDENCLRKLMWVWPSQANLRFISKVVKGNGLEGVISIGCGRGLFEWLLQQSSGKLLLLFNPQCLDGCLCAWAK